MPDEGKSLSFSDGVKKTVENPEINASVLRLVANMTGNSTCREATLKFSRRWAIVPSTEKEGSTERPVGLVGQTGMASQIVRPVSSGEKVPPKLTATSLDWANTAQAVKKKTSRTAKRSLIIVAPCGFVLRQRDHVNLHREDRKSTR